MATLLPDLQLRNDGYVGVKPLDGSAPTFLNALKDADDATYVRKPSTAAATFGWLRLADHSAIASTSFIASATLRCRMAQGGSGQLEARLYSTSNATFIKNVISGAVGQIKTISSYSRSGLDVTLNLSASHTIPVGATIVVEGVGTNFNGKWTTIAGTTGTVVKFTSTTSGTVGTTTVSGASVTYATNRDYTIYNVPGSTTLLTSTMLNDFSIGLNDTTSKNYAGSRPRIFDVSTIVTVGTRPTWSAAPTTSSTSGESITTTTRPTIVLGDYQQAESYQQNGVQVKVFTAAKTDPTVSTDLVWDSGTLGNVSTVKIDTDLVNGTTYYVYVRTACDASSTGTLRAWSLWGSGTATSTVSFTLNLTPPNTPTISAAWGTSTQRVGITVTGSVTGTPTPPTPTSFDLQRSHDSGSTWYPVRGASTATVASNAISVIDREMLRNSSVQYRARARATVSGVALASAWSSPVTTVSTTGSALTWCFRTFNATTFSDEVLDARVLADVSIKQEELVGVFRPLGRSTPIVVHGDLEGYDGSWTIRTTGTSERDALLKIINGQRLALVQDPFGGYRYVRIVGRSWTISGSSSSPNYEFAVDYVEVGGDSSGVSSTGTTVPPSGSGGRIGTNDEPPPVGEVM